MEELDELFRTKEARRRNNLLKEIFDNWRKYGKVQLQFTLRLQICIESVPRSLSRVALHEKTFMTLVYIHYNWIPLLLNPPSQSLHPTPSVKLKLAFLRHSQIMTKPTARPWLESNSPTSVDTFGCLGQFVYCSQTKFVAIILVLSVFFMQFFASDFSPDFLFLKTGLTGSAQRALGPLKAFQLTSLQVRHSQKMIWRLILMVWRTVLRDWNPPPPTVAPPHPSPRCTPVVSY